MFRKNLFIISFLSVGLYFNISFSSYLEFYGNGSFCIIYRDNGAKVFCNKKGRLYRLNEEEIVISSSKLNEMESNKNIEKYNHGFFRIYKLPQKERSVWSISYNFLKTIFDGAREYTKKKANLFSRGDNYAGDLRHFNPSLSFIYPNEKIYILLNKSVNNKNLKVFIYEDGDEGNRSEIKNFEFNNMSNYIKISIDTGSLNLKENTFYNIVIEDNLGAVDKVRVLVIDDKDWKKLNKEKEEIINHMYSSYSVDKDLKEALFYAETGNLLKARDILLAKGIYNLENANLDPNYKKQIEKYLFNLNSDN